MTEKLIQKALLRAFHSHDYKFTNVFYFDNESDWLSFLSSGYCYEVEIKISRSDFKADFKKHKHIIYEANGRKFYTVKGKEVRRSDPDWEFCSHFPELVIANERTSYFSYRRASVDLYFTPFCSVEFREFQNEKLPNKFFYAVPKGLISQDEVPEYAGLLYVNDDLTVTKVKDGKFIHRQLLDKRKLWNKTYYAYAREMAQKLNSV